MRRLAVPLVSVLVVALVLLIVSLAIAPVAGQESGDTNATIVEISLGEDGESVSDQERQRVVSTVSRRLSGVSGYNGTIEPSGEGLVLRVRPAAPPRVVDRLLQRGNFSFVARTPAVDGVEALSNEDVERVGTVRVQSGTPFVPLQLTDRGAGEFSATVKRLNITANPGGCDSTNRTGYCLIVQLDGTALNTAGVTPRLADAIENDQFNRSKSFFLTASGRSEVERLRVALATEPLPVSATASSVRNTSSADANSTATATPTETETETATATVTAGPTDTPATDSSGASGAGFTPTAVVAALLVLGGLVGQRVRS